jgi:hypothetical protein
MKSNIYDTALNELMNSVDQIPSWEADSHSASQEVPRLL